MCVTVPLLCVAVVAEFSTGEITRPMGKKPSASYLWVVSLSQKPKMVDFMRFALNLCQVCAVVAAALLVSEVFFCTSAVISRQVAK